jgi:hypothetical protein
MRFFSISFALVAVLIAASIAGADLVDRNPAITYDEVVPENWAGLLAPWDLLFSFETATITGLAGNTGSEWDGTYYYSARWASNLIHQYDASANLMKEFSVPGVANVRDLAWDGNLMYGGAAGGTIWGFDPINETLEETIAGNFQCRAIAYDSDNDNFIVSNWGDPVWIVERSGSVSGQFNLITTTSTYGFAYDNSCGDNPTLWIFDQGGGSMIHEYDLTVGNFTGFTYDVTADFPSTIAGALFIADDHTPGLWVIGGLAQDGFGTDPFFVYELCDAAAAIAVDIEPANGTVFDPGDIVQYNVTLSNLTPDPLPVTARTFASGPTDFNITLQGPVNVTIPGGSQIGPVTLQYQIPVWAPPIGADICIEAGGATDCYGISINP